MSHDTPRRCFLTGAFACLAATSVDAAEDLPPAVKSAVDEARSEWRKQADDSAAEKEAAYGQALVARFGPAVVDVIRETTIGRVRARQAAAEIPRRDLDAVKTRLWDRLGDAYDFEVLERTAQTLKFKVTRCPWAERMRRLGAADLGFAYHCAYDYGFCEGLNPAIQFTRTKTLMQGDDCCDHAYALRVPDAKPE